MTRPDVTELLQAIAAAQGVDVAQAHADQQEARARELQDREAMRAAMRRRRAEGQTTGEIAAALGVNRGTVSKATGKARDTEARDRIHELLTQGMTDAQIMDTLTAEGDRRHRGKLQYLIRASRREPVQTRVQNLSLQTPACPTERGSTSEAI